MQKKCLFLSLFIVTLLFLSLSPAKGSAQSNCLPYNNGGITNRQYCPSPAPTSATVTAFPTQPPATSTKGGQKVYPAVKTKTTPSTGPEAWALPLLFILAGAGLLLRNKTKLLLKTS